MGTRVTALKRLLSGPLQGVAIACYAVLLPIVIVTRWRSAGMVAHPLLERSALLVLAAMWCYFVLRVIVDIRRHDATSTSGVAWLAGLILGALPFLSAHHTTVPHDTVSVTRTFTSVSGFSALLATKRQRDELRSGQQSSFASSEDLELLFNAHHFLTGGRSGTAVVPEHLEDLPAVHDDDPVVVCPLEHTAEGTVLAYARPGAVLCVPGPFSANQLRERLVGLPDVRLVFADTELELLRALATRTRTTAVVFTGEPAAIDQTLRDLCVCVTSDAPEDLARIPVEVALLRSVPQVLGLTAPFVPALRRRCVEMVAYLSLHHEPVSGERLRTRVIVNADVDASRSTLSNVATSIRRSLGSENGHPRLMPVSAEGLYELRGVSSDVALFHHYVATAKRQPDQSLELASRALSLIHGEPLSSVTKGYEWFFLEGHLASLQRDAEWAAHEVATQATDRGHYDHAFWALRQGLAVDPGNDALRDALYAVPRLGQFGRDGANAAQDQTIGPGGAVAMRWSLERFRY